MAKLSLNPDPGFDINVAFNTMNKRLGELVNSGKMSLDQARAAQSEMRALQLNPAAANRQAATDIFQRHLQVGKYHPENVAAAQRAAERAAQQPQGGLTLAQPAQETARRPYAILGMPTPENGMAPQIKQQTPTQAQVDAYYAGNPDMNNSYWNPYTGSFETRPQVSQPSAPQGVGGTGQSFNPVTAPPSPPRPPEEIMVTPYQRMPEIVTPPQEIMVTPQRMPEIAAPPPPPSVMPPPPIRTYYDPEGPVMPPPSPYPAQPPMATPLPYNPVNTTRLEDLRPGSGMGIGGILNALRNMQLPQGVGGMPRQGSPNALTIGRGPVPLDQQGPPLGGGIGAFLGAPGQAIQAGRMLPKLAEMLKPKMPQSTGVDNTTFIAGDPNFRFGETTQQAPQNAQAMAMGGLLRKYYGGGMC